ncbi:MAG TPA: ABC transporter ATP-binding protein [Geminicoccaceae bacterium]|nr:ABC transporter ATP-binding protein [Geminicoccaceae bacterium]
MLRVVIGGKRFPAVGEAPERYVLGRLDLGLAAGEVLAITGPSGCGKTTLLNLVARLDRDFEGNIERPAGRLAYVFQEPRLLPWRTVAQNLALVLPDAADTPRRIAGALDEVGLGDAASTFASRLSLGMARRVALARAFVVHPDLLLLDEPFASLDAPTAWRLRLLLLDLLAAHRASVLFVTHDIEEAVMLAHRLVMLSGTPAVVTADIPIEIDAAARRDPARVAEATRQVLAQLGKRAA